MGASLTGETLILPLQCASDQAHTGMFRLAAADVTDDPGYVAEQIDQLTRMGFPVTPLPLAELSRTEVEQGLEAAGLVSSGSSPDDRLVEFIELPGHPFWVGTQAHPEFKSRPDNPHPLFAALVAAALERADGRAPRLLDIDGLAAVP